MNIEYTFTHSDLSNYLHAALLTSKGIRRNRLLFGVLPVIGFGLVLAGAVSANMYLFIPGIALIGTSSLSPNLKKEVALQIEQLERIHNLNAWYGINTLTFEPGALLVQRGGTEERIAADRITEVTSDKKFIAVILKTGRLIIPTRSLKGIDPNALVQALEKIRKA